ncbi:MAG: hypothetical protein ABJD68_04040, partial [Nakamurella sp.]
MNFLPFDGVTGLPARWSYRHRVVGGRGNDRCLDIVADADRCQQAIVGALADASPAWGGIGRPPERTQLYSRAHRIPSSVAAQFCTPIPLTRPTCAAKNE